MTLSVERDFSQVQSLPIAEPTVILVDVFGGISASRMACIYSGLKVVSHIYIENNRASIRVAQFWFPDLYPVGDICQFRKQHDSLLRFLRAEIDSHPGCSVLFVAGFPCRELSAINPNG